jgi:citrate synthase
MAEKLFEITTDHLETGLRGYPIGYCNTSTVDPVKGLFYVGKPVSELASRAPGEVIYLLFHGKEGTPDELAAFKGDLKKRSLCSQETLEAIRRLPRQGHPMALFSSAILIAGMIEAKGDYREDALNLIAKIPEIAACVINHHAGWGKEGPSDPSLGYMENFTRLLKVPHKNEKALIHIFRLFDILHFDHGGGNLSTFVGKAIASGLEDMYGSISGAMCALAGPRHGRANQDCLELVQNLLKELGENPTQEAMEASVKKRLEDKELIFGFGHAVLRVEDPRATILYQVAEELYPNHPYIKIAKCLREVGPKILSQNPKISDPYPNVDAISGVLLSAAGFEYPEYFTVLFGMSRAVGIAIQILYERLYARGGKGTPIVRPKYIYKAREV